MAPFFEIRHLKASIEGKTILNGIDLAIQPGEVHALMGPNGSGKSTLAYTLMGHPKYTVLDGEILLNGENLRSFKTDERARKGLFLAFQYPMAIPGVSVGNFLRTMMKSARGAEFPVKEFRTRVKEKMALLEMDDSFISRYLNDGFSGGEKKRLEALQMSLLAPKLAVLDEPDSGLDIDALKSVAEGINKAKAENPSMGILLITHYQRILNYIQPDKVHILLQGKIVKSGGKELVEALEAKGYEWIEKETAEAR